MIYRPLGKYILVKQAKSPEKVGSLILTNTESKSEGEVVAVGIEVKEVKAGDHVFFLSRTGIPIKDENHFIFREMDILAVIDEE